MKTVGRLQKLTTLIMAITIVRFSLPPLLAQENKNKGAHRALETTKQTDSNAPKTGNSESTNRQPRLVAQLGHLFKINCVAFSPDGRHVLTGGGDKTAILWETDTAREIRRFVGHSGSVLSIAFSPDCHHILTGSADKTARLWDIETGIEIRRFVGHSDSIWSVAFSPDGRYVLTGSYDNTARLWDAASGAEIRLFSGHSNAVLSVTFSPDGRYVLTGSYDKTARLWEVDTGKEIRRFEERHDYDTTADAVTSVAYSPDGQHILTVSGRVARVWKVETGKKVLQFEDHLSFNQSTRKAVYSPDGRYVLTGDVNPQLWDARTGALLRTFKEPSPRGMLNPSIAYSPEGQYVLTVSFGTAARLWEVETEKEVRSFQGYSSVVNSFAYWPEREDRYVVIAGDDGTVRLFDIQTTKEVRRFDGHSDSVLSVAYSPDGKYLLTGSADGTARLWNADTGEELRRFEMDANKRHEYTVRDASGKEHVIGSTPDSDNRVGSVAFSPDGRYVLTGTSDMAQMWDTETGKQIRRIDALPSHGIYVYGYCVAYSADGRYVLTGRDKIARIWDAETGKEAHPLVHPDVVTSIAYSPKPEDHYVLTGSHDGTVRLWDTETGKEVRRFVAHSDGVFSVAYSPDGKYALTGSADGTARVWDIETAKEIKRFDTGVGNGSVVFSQDGRFVLTLGKDSTIRFWSVSTEKELCRLVLFRDGNWAWIDSQGHFDASSLEEIKGLHWVMPDEPMKTYPIEIFMRDYYEPRLLPRILNGEEFKSIRSVAELNRVQPTVKITGIEQQKNKPEQVNVTVEVSKARAKYKQGDKTVTRETGVYDLRLFRDGQIVGQYSDGKPQALPRPASNDDKLLAWRNENEVKLDANGKRTIKFENIKLPQSAGKRDVQFTAYAFNEDRVKSETAKTDKPFTYEVTKDKARRGRAYLISAGVNAYENPTFDLRYSVNDARAIQQTIFDRLSQTGDYAEIVQVPLISDYEVRLAGKSIPSQEATKEQMAVGQKIVISQSATKANFKAVLDVLAGRRKPTELPDSIPDGERLRKQLHQANPEDLLLISFSSHGYTDSDGNFYFVFSDTGPSTGGKITEELLQKLSPKFISSEELSQWLRDVDGGEMLMIVDACHSAAAVEGQEFKPGPMGSRGLGQLSYDKGMRILTATQASDVAYGSGALKQGLLTYVLVKDGIEAGKADFKPKDNRITISEWLQYGEQGVPKLLEDAGTRAKQEDAPVELKELVQKTMPDVKTQHPSLFDFSRKRTEVLLVKP